MKKLNAYIESGRISTNCPSDNIELDEIEFETAKRAVSIVSQIMEARATEKGNNSNSKNLFLPDGNWSLTNTANSLDKLTALIQLGEYDTINNLRFHTNEITGYKLLYFTPYKITTIHKFPENNAEIFEKIFVG